MQFMLMCCFDEARWSALAEEQRAKIMQDYKTWIDEHVANGKYLGGGKLDESMTASTLRKQDRELRVTDGPFAESREQIGGFHLIECADRDAALVIAEGIPTLPFGGTVEVRPLLARLGAQ
jgi:hypothetical protein